jgi:nitrate reductase NapAB chaperone NapD
MQICSYLVYPVKGKIKTLKEKLLLLSGCKVLQAENRDVLILVTETNGDAEETNLQQSLKKIKEVQCLALTFGSLEKVVDKPDLKRKGS